MPEPTLMVVEQRARRGQPMSEQEVEELKALAGGELDPVLTRQLDKVARKVAETKRGAEESAAVRAMDAATATEYLRNAFAWLPDPIERVEQDRTHAGHETYWFVMMSGRRIELGPCLSVMNCRLTESKIIPATTLVMPVEMKKKGAWAPVASAIFRAAVVLDPDWSPDVDIMEWVRAYAEFAKDGEWEAAHYARLPHIRDGELRVQAEKMSEWVFTDRAQRVGRKELSKLLESIGMHRRQITAKHPTASTGRRVGRSFHCGPASLLGGE